MPELSDQEIRLAHQLLDLRLDFVDCSQPMQLAFTTCGELDPKTCKRIAEHLEGSGIYEVHFTCAKTGATFTVTYTRAIRAAFAHLQPQEAKLVEWREPVQFLTLLRPKLNRRECDEIAWLLARRYDCVVFFRRGKEGKEIHPTRFELRR